jgi:hypothetical protein
MILNCGFLGKSVGYYYYIQNITLLNSGWKNVVIISQDVPLVEYDNNGSELKFELSSDNEYINFKINDKIFRQSKNLFKITLDVTPESNESNFYKIEENWIVDH